MRKIKNQIKLIVSLFVLIILFQSCIAYKSISVTLEQSVKENVKTKIKTNDGKNIKFKYITSENDIYFGVNKKNGELVKVELNENQIKKVRVKNKALSIFLNVLLGASVLILAPAVAFAAGGGV